ncbi:MAG: AmmeMemoRadiSam system radical SAM enzyme [Bacteroidales bacterium]|nr:AmmeMemoRadiSam system radical SAM enzyme [Bacteroidales bacterium]
MKKREFVRKCFLAAGGMSICPDILYGGTLSQVNKNNYRLALYQEETAKGLMCNICPNECVLKEGELSDCRNRIVRKGKLYTMAYGNPCAVNLDPVEKKPLYHFMPATLTFSIATAGCNLACLNCQNWTISQTSPDKTRNTDLMPGGVIGKTLKYKCRSISYTYGEPVTFYEYVLDTASLAKQSGLRNIFVSNGYINREPLLQLSEVLDAANIDLKSFNDKTYLKLTGGKLDPVLETLKTLKERKVWLEITNLIVPEWTDKMDERREMCKWLYANGFSDTPLHFSRFQPMYKLEQLPPTPVAALNKAFDIAKEEGISHVYIGNVPGTHASDTWCSNCGKKVIERKGYSIISNNIEDGLCMFCNSPVSGIWD